MAPRPWPVTDSPARGPCAAHTLSLARPAPPHTPREAGPRCFLRQHPAGIMDGQAGSLGSSALRKSCQTAVLQTAENKHLNICAPRSDAEYIDSGIPACPGHRPRGTCTMSRWGNRMSIFPQRVLLGKQVPFGGSAQRLERTRSNRLSPPAREETRVFLPGHTGHSIGDVQETRQGCVFALWCHREPVMCLREQSGPCPSANFLRGSSVMHARETRGRRKGSFCPIQPQVISLQGPPCDGDKTKNNLIRSVGLSA